MRGLRLAMVAVLLGQAGSACLAAETVTYTYDAKGRLVKVDHAGSPNNGVTTTITLDAADNRRSVKTVGALR